MVALLYWVDSFKSCLLGGSNSVSVTLEFVQYNLGITNLTGTTPLVRNREGFMIEKILLYSSIIGITKLAAKDRDCNRVVLQYLIKSKKEGYNIGKWFHKGSF